MSHFCIKIVHGVETSLVFQTEYENYGINPSGKLNSNKFKISNNGDKNFIFFLPEFPANRLHHELIINSFDYQ